MIDLGALDTWRANVSKNRLTWALVASLVATHMATVSGYWYKIIGLDPLGWPQFNGVLLLAHRGSGGSGVDQFWAGTVYHYGTGICWGLIFAFLLHPLLKISNSFLGNVSKGLLWGLVLGTFSALLWVPRNFPEFHPGFFSNNFGWDTVIGIYLWHLVYGFHLGAFYNPLPKGQQSAS